MRNIVILLLFPLFLISNSIFDNILVAVDNDIDINLNGKNIKKIKSRGSLDAIRNLKKNRANIAIVRGDILGVKKNGILGLEVYENYGIICSPNKSLLYLVSKKDIKSIYDFRNKKISTGVMTNLAQVYLNNVLKNSGLEFDISFRALNLDKSIEALNKGDIDIVFMFASKKSLSKFIDSGLKINSLPNDFFKNLTFRRGLKPFGYKIKGKTIKTFEVQNFIIAPIETVDKNISAKIETIIKKFKCNKTIQTINPFYGALHPLVKDIVNRINQKAKEPPKPPKPPKKEDYKDEPILFLFRREVILNNGTNYIYDIENRVANDINISFLEFKTDDFDTLSIKPRHLISISPKGVIKLKGKSKKMVTFTYKNPFLYNITQRDIGILYKNLSMDANSTSSDMIPVYLRVGDK